MTKDCHNPRLVDHKPQHRFGFADQIVNDDTFFRPRLPTKHHSTTGAYDPSQIILMSQGYARNPYDEEIARFELPAWQRKKPTEIPEVKPLAETPLVLVDSEEKLTAMIAELNASREFAVDLEYHNLRSFLGITCLVQISTLERDFIVDPFPIWRHMNRLNEPFANPQIRKVLHGSTTDITGLQRDFSVYVVNMLDTKELMEALEMPKPSLQALVEMACGVALTKGCRTADWRQRPLTRDLVEYARSDTHYLLRCAHWLSAKVEFDFEERMHAVYEKCRLLCQQPFIQPRFHTFSYRRLLKANLRSSQVSLMKRLWAWKDRTAREEDERPDFILPDSVLKFIVDKFPADVPAIRKCFAQFPIPPAVDARLHEILRLIDDERPAPAGSAGDEAAAGGEGCAQKVTVDSLIQRLTEQKKAATASSAPAADDQAAKNWCEFRSNAAAQPANSQQQKEEEDRLLESMDSLSVTQHQVERLHAAHGQPAPSAAPTASTAAQEIPDEVQLEAARKKKKRKPKKKLFYDPNW